MSPAPAVASPWIGAGSARLRIDERAARGGVVLRDEPLGRDGRELGIGVEPRPVLEGELLCLDQQMQVLGATPLERPEIETLEHVQHLQHGDALTVRRELEDAPAAIRRRHRLDPLGAMRRKILGTQEPAVAPHAAFDGRRNRAVVERAAALVRNERVRSRERRIRKRLADRGRSAVRHEHLGKARVALQCTGAGGPRRADDFRHGETFARVGDRGCEELAQRQAAEACVQLAPAVDGAGHADAEWAAVWNQCEPHS